MGANQLPDDPVYIVGVFTGTLVLVGVCLVCCIYLSPLIGDMLYSSVRRERRHHHRRGRRNREQEPEGGEGLA